MILKHHYLTIKILMSNFVILSRIYPNKKETQTINKVFKYAYHIYSQLFNEVNLIFQNYKEQLKNNKRWEKYKLLKKLKINEYWLQERMKKHRRNYEKYVDSTIWQKIASNLWKSIDKYCFWNWKWLTKKKYYQFTSIEWKSNTTGLITFSKDKSSFMKYKQLLLLKISQFDSFQLENIKWKEISYCRLVRIQWNKKWKYSFQIIFKDPNYDLEKFFECSKTPNWAYNVKKDIEEKMKNIVGFTYQWNTYQPVGNKIKIWGNVLLLATQTPNNNKLYDENRSMNDWDWELMYNFLKNNKKIMLLFLKNGNSNAIIGVGDWEQK